MYPLVAELAADKIPVVVTGRVLGLLEAGVLQVAGQAGPPARLGRRAFDQRRNLDPSRRAAFGYRYITDELADHGITASRNRVNRLCTSEQLWSVHAGKRVLPQTRRRCATTWCCATSPLPTNSMWLTDITEHSTAEGELYLRAVKDACSGRIGGYSIGAQMIGHLSVNWLPRPRVARRSTRSRIRTGAANIGLTPTSGLSETPSRGSMGRVGARAHNAAMEPFFSLSQKNVLNRQRWKNREQRRLAIVVWTEKTYHRRRRQGTLGRMATIEFERRTRAAYAA